MRPSFNVSRAVICRLLYRGTSKLGLPRKDVSLPLYKSRKTDFGLIKDLFYCRMSNATLYYPKLNFNPNRVHDIISKLEGCDLTDYKQGVESLKTIGLFGMLISRYYGGLGLTLSEYLYVLQHNLLLPYSMMLLAHQSLCGQVIQKYGSEEQKEKYLPRMATGEIIGAFCLSEKSSGCDIFSSETFATKIIYQDDYSINGEKIWVMNGAVANLFVVFSNVLEGINEGGRKKITCFLVDRNEPGVSVSPPYEIEALNKLNVADVSFENVYVTESDIVGESVGGFKIASNIQNYARLDISAVLAAIGRQMVEEMCERNNDGFNTVDSNDVINRGLLEDSVQDLFGLETTIFFTARHFDEMSLLKGPTSIELESAAVKLYTMDRIERIMKNYVESIPLEFNDDCHHDSRHQMLQMQALLKPCLGSFYSLALYIGGTIVEDYQNDMYNFNDYMRENKEERGFAWFLDFGFMKKVLQKKNILFPSNPVVKDFVGNEWLCVSQLSMAVNKTIFIMETVGDIVRNLAEDSRDFQLAMSVSGEILCLLYSINCTIARVNYTLDKKEEKLAGLLTQRMISEVNKKLDALREIRYKRFMISPAELFKNIKKDAGNYILKDVLDMRRKYVEISSPPTSSTNNIDKIKRVFKTEF